MKPAVFLDRDGTLIEEGGYLDRLDRLVFFPYSVDAVRLLNRGGFAVVDRHEPVRRRARHLRGVVRRRGAPAHRPSGWPPAARASTRSTTARITRTASSAAIAQACDCRKPQPGHVARAAAELGPRSGALVRGRRSLERPRGRAGGRRAQAFSSAPATAAIGEASPKAGVAAGRRRRQPDAGRLLDPAQSCHDREDRPRRAGRPGRLLALVDDFAGTRVGGVRRPASSTSSSTARSRACRARRRC